MEERINYLYFLVLKQIFLNNRSDFGPAVLLLWAVGLDQGFLWSESPACAGFSRRSWPCLSMVWWYTVPLVGGQDLDRSAYLRRAGVVWRTRSLLPWCQALFLGVYPMRTLPWYDSVDSSPKVKDYSEERLFWSILANCSFIGRKKWQNVFPDYF